MKDIIVLFRSERFHKSIKATTYSVGCAAIKILLQNLLGQIKSSINIIEYFSY